MQTAQPAGSFSTAVKVTLVQNIRDSINQDGAVLLDIDRGLCLSLNIVGAKIWQMLKMDQSGEQIITALGREFTDVPRPQLQQDYLDFLRQLETNSLACLQMEWS
jgi:hypothetical protein